MTISLDELLTSQPWKAFNGYQWDVNQALIRAKSDQHPKPTAVAEAKNLSVGLGAISLSFLGEAKAMFEALPEKERLGLNRVRCSGLPRAYPKMWMRRPHSNSLAMEFRLVQNAAKTSLSVEAIARLMARYELAKVEEAKKVIGGLR